MNVIRRRGKALRLCERSEAISCYRRALSIAGDCFVADAPRNDAAELFRRFLRRPPRAPAVPDHVAGHPAAVVEIGRAHVELQSLMRISYAVFCLKTKNKHNTKIK